LITINAVLAAEKGLAAVERLGGMSMDSLISSKAYLRLCTRAGGWWEAGGLTSIVNQAFEHNIAVETERLLELSRPAPP
jgi:hypothetical protein